MPASPPDQRETAQALLTLTQNLVAELHPGKPLPAISLDSTLDKDLSLDSLGRVELLHRIERHFDLVPPERLFAEAETPRDLLRVLLQASPSSAQTHYEVENLVLAGGQAAPFSANTLIDTLEWHVGQHPDRTHIRIFSDEDEGTTLTYRDLKTQACKVASGLQALGIRTGDAIAIMLPTSPEYFISFIGVLLAGGIPVPVYPPPRMSLLEEHLLRYVGILNNCSAPVLISIPEGKLHAKRLSSLAGNLAHIATVDELTGTEGSYAAPAIKSSDIAFLQYTSGSTGAPKGVVLTHANLLANIRAMGQAVNARPEDVFVSWLPLYHDMGLIGAWLGSLYHAMPLVVMPPLSFISRPLRWFQAIHRFRGTLSAAPNFGYETCLRRLEDKDLAGLDLSCWRAAFNGAEAVVPETVERFIQRFKPYGFRPEAMMPVYGLAESSVGLGFPPLGRGVLIDNIQRETFTLTGHAIPAGPDRHNALRFVASGLPLPGHQIRVVDEAGRELPERHQGRIEFRGPSSTSGYYRNSGQTRALFHGEWLDSGDLGYMVGGELFVTGRIKDIIIRAGRNIYPHEVEQAVSDIEGIRKGCVAAFGSIDPASGTERLVVMAEIRRQEPNQSEALAAQINRIVTELIGEPPDDVVLAPPGAVLKTSSGKVRRTAIRERYERGEIGQSKHSAWQARLALAGESLGASARKAWLKTGEWLFAAYAWGIFGLIAPVVWISVLLLPKPSWRCKFLRGSIRFLQTATRVSMSVQGLENLPAAGHSFILAANHSSYLDVYVLTAALTQPVSFVAKAELGVNPLLGVALKRIGTEFVERFDAEKGVSDARKLAGALKHGRPLVFFPEGTFSRRPGLLPFHLGAFSTAVESDVPVVPVALRGTRSMLRDGSWFPRRGTLAVTIGKPLYPALIKQEFGGDAWKTTIRLRELAREHILRHTGEPDLGADTLLNV